MVCRLWRRMASAMLAACLVGVAGCDKLLEPPGAPPPPPRGSSETPDSGANDGQSSPTDAPVDSGLPPNVPPSSDSHGPSTTDEEPSDVTSGNGEGTPAQPDTGSDTPPPSEDNSGSDDAQGGASQDDAAPPQIEPPASQPDAEDVSDAGAPSAPPETGTDEDDGVTPAFLYYPPGYLEEDSGSGVRDDTVYVPDMVFPIKDARAYPQSQVYRYGGYILGGDQCDPRNFTAPWRDNYCEKRSTQNSTPYCPASRVHLGQDIRVGTPEGCRAEVRTPAAQRKRYAVVAAEDGVISNVGRYTVNLRAGGRIYRYMHMNMQALKVTLGQTVKAGDVLGYVSNDFGGAATTLHLHFEIKHNTAEHGWTWAPPYTSLVKAYERREGASGKLYSEAE